jgi:Phage protein Gp138 N-terminal domain
MAFNEPLDNPYNHSVQDYRPETPTLDRVIQKGIDKNLLRLHTCLPGVITAVQGSQRVTVQPLLKKRHVDPAGVEDTGILIPIQPIADVPVQMPVGGLYYIKGPIEVGDTGMIIFSERSLDVWLSSTGDMVDPLDSRHHDISDAIFVPGLVPFESQISDETMDIVISNGLESGQVRVTQEGDILLGSGSSDSPAVLGDVLSSGLNDLSMALTTFATGLNPGTLAAQAAALVVAVQAFVLQYLTNPTTNIESQQTFLQREST